MNEQRIWAPWRIGYISGNDRPDEPPIPNAWREGADSQCFLCRAAATYKTPDEARRKCLIVEVGKHTLTLLNRYPYTNGHLLVAPLRHVGSLDELTEDEHLETMRTLAKYTQRLRERFSAEAFNVGLNLGQIAGAGVPGHLHWHLVPRWAGDHNFMPTVAGIRVISQSLEAAWEALTEEDV